MLKIDLHVHTQYSDSRSSVPEILSAASGRGLDGIAITDHLTLWGVRAARRLQKTLLIIPGIEFATRRGHLLGLGIPEDGRIPWRIQDRPAVEVAQWIRSVNGLVVIPHPCTPFFSMPRHIIERVRPDAIEVLNAHSPFFRWDSRRSRRLAAQLDVAHVAGSDSHTWQTVGDAYTLIDAEPRVDAVLQAIQEGRTSVEGTSSLWRYKLGVLQRLLPDDRRRLTTPRRVSA